MLASLINLKAVEGQLLQHYHMTIAVIAHDSKKAEMVAFIKDHAEAFHARDINLIATGTTGSHIAKAGLEVQRMESGPMGGDAQIASRLVEAKIDMVIFFRDPSDLSFLL